MLATAWYRMILILVTVIVVAPLTSAEQGHTRDEHVLCVAPDGNPEGSGACWEDPLDLVGAVARAEPGTQLWLKQGKYVPGADPHSAFYLPDGVAITGGFTGSQSQAAKRSKDATLTVLDGEASRYTVIIAAGVTEASLETLTIANGAATLIADEATDLQRRGGGIYVSNASISLDNVVVRDNRARFGGAGLYIDEPSDLQLSNVVFRDNQTTHPQSGRGGGMRIQAGTISITDSRFESNQAVRGGGVFIDNGDVMILRSEFVQNDATDYGGGISIYAGALSIDESEFEDNLAVTEGGAIYAARSTGAVHITDSELSENRAGSGGGAGWLQAAEVVIERSGFLENSAGTGPGGGLYLGHSEAKLHNLRIQGNQAGRGGGVTLHNSDSELVNGLISGNLARPVNVMLDPAAGRIGQGGNKDGSGGGLAISGSGRAAITNLTIAANGSTGPGSAIAYSGQSALKLGNSILSANRQLGNHVTGRSLSIELPDDEELSDFQITHSILEGGCPQEERVSCDRVMTDDPLFRELPSLEAGPSVEGDFRLWFTSPAVDAGSDELLSMQVSADLAGKERRIQKRTDSAHLRGGSSIDLGALETQIPESEPDTQFAISHSEAGRHIEIDARTDTDGHVSGTVEVETADLTIDAYRAGRLYREGDHIILDGEALLPGGALVGIIVEIDSATDSSDLKRYRIRLDTGASTGWIEYE